MQRADNARFGIGSVVHQVDAGRGAVILAGGVNRVGAVEATFVFLQRGRGDEGVAVRAPAAEEFFQEERGVVADQGFRQRLRLDQHEPVKIRGGEGLVGAGVHGGGRRDVEQHQLFDGARMVQRQPVRHAATPIVTADEIIVMAQRQHHFVQVLRHGALGIIAVVGQALGPRRIAVATQVRHHQAIMLLELRCQALPDCVGLRIAVQQQQRRADATVMQVDLDAVDGDALVLELLEHQCCPRKRTSPRRACSTVCSRTA